MRNKTNPIGVRFDIDKLEFVKTKMKLNTSQQVVDYFLNWFWWEHKMPIPTHKESPPLELKVIEHIQPTQVFTTPQKQAITKSLFDTYLDERYDLGSQDDFDEWLSRVQNDNRLTVKQKDYLPKAVRK